MLVTKKIKAFTIAELIVVLVLTSIVISIALVVLNLIQKQVSGIQYNLKKQNRIQILDKLLWHDFNKYKLHFNHKENILLCSNPLDTVTYQFNKDFVLRDRDTLKVDIVQTVFYLDAEKVTKNTMDAIEIHFSEKFQNKILFIYKTKDSTYYMNRNKTIQEKNN